MTDDYISTRTAAELAGIGQLAITRAIQRGRLPAIKPARDFLIRKQDLDAYLASRPAYYQQQPPPDRTGPKKKEQRT